MGWQTVMGMKGMRRERKRELWTAIAFSSCFVFFGATLVIVVGAPPNSSWCSFDYRKEYHCHWCYVLCIYSYNDMLIIMIIMRLPITMSKQKVN